MDKKKFYTQDEAKDILIGKVGTPQRDSYESDLNMFLIGDVIKRTRLEKNLTQEDLGKLVGVQKAQISKIENGKNLTIATIIKVFKAMGVSAQLEIDNNRQKVALC
jgi:DNA-binding XRE family transcriptional regulator